MPRATQEHKKRKEEGGAFISGARRIVVGDEPFDAVRRTAASDPQLRVSGHPLDRAARRGKGPGDSSGAARLAERVSERASKAFRKPVITDPAYIKRCRRQSPAAGRGLRLPSLFLYPFLFSAFLLPRSRASPPSLSPRFSPLSPAGPYFYRVDRSVALNVASTKWTSVYSNLLKFLKIFHSFLNNCKLFDCT